MFHLKIELFILLNHIQLHSNSFIYFNDFIYSYSVPSATGFQISEHISELSNFNGNAK